MTDPAPYHRPTLPELLATAPHPPGVDLPAERLARALSSLRMLARVARGPHAAGLGATVADAVDDVAGELPGAIDLPADALRLWCLAAGTAVEVVSGVPVLGVTVERLCLAAAGLYAPPAEVLA